MQLIYDAHNGHREADLTKNGLNYDPKKGAAVSPLNCRVKNPANQPNKENTRLNQYFFGAWTPFSLVKKVPLSICQTGHYTSLFEIRSCSH